MTLSIPDYLKSAEIQSSELRYEWDDWKTLPASQDVDPEVAERLKNLSQRAIFAFMCGSAEWTVYRFARLAEVAEAWSFMEGAWAMTVDVRYCGYGTGNWWQEYASEGWNGPVRGVIYDALEILEIAIQQWAWERNDAARPAGLLSALTNYVMPSPEPYERWTKAILARLEGLYPRDPNDRLGDVVPREALDPGVDFRTEETERLINRFLAGLDYRSNPFLSSPDGMLEPDDAGESFRGIPYVFDMAADRRARLSR